jgi:hypothetical protein
MKKILPVSRGLLIVVVVGAVALTTNAEPKKPGGGGGCPRNVFCPDVWDPVICSDGKIYSNSCYAYRECATGCQPYGDGGPVPLDSKAKPGGNGGCHHNVMCPDVVDPVICSDGKIYVNSCYAYRECATGCQPYGDGGPVPLDSKKKPGGGTGGGCPRDIVCPEVWNPVICSDGHIYSNACFADQACATGCQPYGDGVIIAAESGTE